MARLPIADTWDDTRRFIAREQALLLPIGLATFGVGALLLELVVPQATNPSEVKAGAWVLWLLPIMLLLLTGNLALSRIAQRPGSSVEENFVVAFRLLPRAVVTMIAFSFAVGLIGAVVGMIAGGLALLFGLGAANASALVTATLLTLGFWSSVRLALMWPVLADRNSRPIETIALSLSATRGYAMGLGGLFFLSGIIYLVSAVVLHLAGGSVMMIIARLVGEPTLGRFLESILTAGFNALFMTAWTVFLARLYVRLAR